MSVAEAFAPLMRDLDAALKLRTSAALQRCIEEQVVAREDAAAGNPQAALGISDWAAEEALLREEIWEGHDYGEEVILRDPAENVCVSCGCSDSRACPGGCVWATETLCSRCVMQ